MHYRNGREAKNGDRIISLDNGKISALGVLYDAQPNNDYCNGFIAPLSSHYTACLCDCLHVDDVLDLLKQVGLDKRLPNK